MMPSGSPSNKPPSPSPSPGSGVFTRVVNNVINNVANMFGSHQTDQPDEGPCNDAVVKGIQDTAARISLSEAQGSVQQPSTPIQVTELQFDAGAQGHVSLPTLDARMEHGNFASPVTHYPQNMSVDMSDADFSVLAQLVPSESYFAVTRSEYPILAGQSAPTGSYNQAGSIC